MEATPVLYQDRKRRKFRAKGGSGFRVVLMRSVPRLTTYSFPVVIVLVASAWLLAIVSNARASTYVVYVALDDPVYQELDTLDGLGNRLYLGQIVVELARSLAIPPRSSKPGAPTLSHPARPRSTLPPLLIGLSCCVAGWWQVSVMRHFPLANRK